jgi:hypothetical protein
VTLKSSSFSVAVARASRFAWPADGGIMRYFGSRGSKGIDIAISAERDTSIKASAAGRVASIGPNPCCSGGSTVTMDHGGGVTTLYGALSDVLVTRGQELKQGDLINMTLRPGQSHSCTSRSSAEASPSTRCASAMEQGSWYRLETVSLPVRNHPRRGRVHVHADIRIGHQHRLSRGQRERLRAQRRRSGRLAGRACSARTAFQITVREAAVADGQLSRFKARYGAEP